MIHVLSMYRGQPHQRHYNFAYEICRIQSEKLEQYDLARGQWPRMVPMEEVDRLQCAWTMLVLALKYHPELDEICSRDKCVGWQAYMASTAKTCRDYHDSDGSMATKKQGPI